MFGSNSSGVSPTSCMKFALAQFLSLIGKSSLQNGLGVLVPGNMLWGMTNERFFSRGNNVIW